ncbi:MAG: PA domain-containing protein [Jiangellaceae bacterium]
MERTVRVSRRRTTTAGVAGALLVAALAWTPTAQAHLPGVDVPLPVVDGVDSALPGADSQLAASPGDVELFNLEHVFNFNPEDHDPERHDFVGSDLEFFTSTVPLRDYATGQFVDESGNPVLEPVMAERDFSVMGSFQRGGYVFDITDPEHPQFVSQVTCRQDRNDVAIRTFTDEATGAERVVLALTQQSGVPCADAEDDGGVGVEVNSPAELEGFHGSVQWGSTAEVDGQTADLVYAGTGCTPVSYATVAGQIAGNIALVDDRASQTNPLDQCPAYTFLQKVQSAQQAGAIGFVQIPEEDAEPNGNATAVTADIPALEVHRTDEMLAVRDAVIAGTAVNVTLTQAPTEVPVIGEGSGGIGVFDITDPFAWAPMYRLLTGNGGVHNFIFNPTQPYGYAANGALPGLLNDIPIVDFTDVDDPVVLTGRAPTEGGVHDVEFSPDGNRAYAASENNYRIYDTTDAANPVLLSRTLNVGSYAHGVFPTSDSSLMVTNNESLVLGGFLVEGTGVCPGEGLASYDTTDESLPIGPLGYYVPNVVGPSGETPCTSHFGRFAPDTRVLSIGWYAAGSRVVDWSDPSSPVEVAGAVLEGSNVWAAKFFEGPYLYAGDINRGFDVFRWSGDGPAPWLSP